MPLVVLYALDEELRPILNETVREAVVSSNQTRIIRGKFRGIPIVLCRTGIGMGNANEAAKHLLGLYQPSLLISAGYCGALREGMKSGELILPTEIRSEANDSFKPDPEGSEKLSNIIEGEKIPCHTGPLVTVFSPLRSPEEKRNAGRKGSIAVDMETAAIAGVCQKKNVPLVALRVIFDPVEMDLPINSQGKLSARGFFKIPKLMMMNRRCQGNLCQITEKYLQSGW